MLEAWPALWHCQGVVGSLRANALWEVSRLLGSCTPHGPWLDPMRERSVTKTGGALRNSAFIAPLVTALPLSPITSKFPPKAENRSLCFINYPAPNILLQQQQVK